MRSRWRLIFADRTRSPEPRPAAIGLRIHLAFWIVTILPVVTGGVRRIALWTATVLVSTCVAALVVALVGMAMGHRARVTLGLLGGRTTFEPKLATRSRSLIWLMGPVISLTTGVVLWMLRSAHDPTWLSLAMQINLAWGAISLLPISPFAGGQMLAVWLGPHRRTTAMLVSLFTAEAAAAVACVLFKSPWLASLLVAAGVRAASDWLQSRRVEFEDASLEQLHAASRRLEQRSYREAHACAIASLRLAETQATRDRALAIRAWAALGLASHSEARDVLGRIHPRRRRNRGFLAPFKPFAGRTSRAISTAKGAMSDARLEREYARLAVDLHASEGDLKGVARTALEFFDALGADDVRLIVSALQEGGEFQFAAELAKVLFGVTSAVEDGLAEVRALSQVASPERVRLELESVVDRLRVRGSLEAAATQLSQLRTDPLLRSLIADDGQP
jgi:hypothetical protein